MGWIHRKHHNEVAYRSPATALPIHSSDLKGSTEPSSEFVEDTKRSSLWPAASLDTPDTDLPFITSTAVAEAHQSGFTWLVIDNIVYDCTKFVAEHPGGPKLIEAFQGQDCSWQFWRFHGDAEMRGFGRPLRIGHTKGVKNRFDEPKKFVGLRKFWQSDW
ncbi:cytochrome b5-like heme/Steroid binding domain-containing protein [Sarocladium implicatum]|nr:cytochrome b5-like heme/Steroid binding domain-containing protein [Sarocladium implicatum]